MEANGYSSQLWPAGLRRRCLQGAFRRFRRIWARFVVLVNRLGFPNLIAYLMLAQTLGILEQGNRMVGQRRRRPRPRLPNRLKNRIRPRSRGARSVLKSPLASSSSDMDKCCASSNGNPAASSSDMGKCCASSNGNPASSSSDMGKCCASSNGNPASSSSIKTNYKYNIRNFEWV